MAGHKAWSTTIPTGSCWGLFGGALSWVADTKAPGAPDDAEDADRGVARRSVIDLAAIERQQAAQPAPSQPHRAAKR